MRDRLPTQQVWTGKHAAEGGSLPLCVARLVDQAETDGEVRDARTRICRVPA
jgi:hypothetical protein